MKGKRLWRGLLIGILALVFAGSLAGVIVHIMNDRRGAEDYAEASALAQFPSLPDGASAPLPPRITQLPGDENGETPATAYVWNDPYADALREMDFSALQEVNPDVIGWIVIPNTVISYPLLHGNDNEYYLKHTWKGDRNAVGAIFMESRCGGTFRDFNTIIYGHRMRGGSMFGTLKYFGSASYWQEHPYIYVATENGEYTYAIFAAYEAELESDTYRINISDETERQAFIDYCVGRSAYDTGIVPTVNDHILTLSTCTGNGHATRWVVQAVLIAQTAPQADAPETDSPEEALEEALPEEPTEETELPPETQEGTEIDEEGPAGPEE